MNSQNNKNHEYWKLVSPNDYAPPSPTVDRTLKKRTLELLREIGVGKTKKIRDAERVIPPSSFEKSPPEPEIADSYWSEAVEALDDWLEGFAVSSGTEFRKRGRALIGPPYGGHSRVLKRWARKKGCRIVEPPAPENILQRDDSIFRRLSVGAPDELIVIPELERFFLRTLNGLFIVRNLFEKLYEGKIGRILFGCDSWAWAFLSHVLGEKPVPAVIAQAFSPDVATAWLASLVIEGRSEKFVFRSLNDGSYVLPPANREESDSEKEFKAVSDIKLLSEFCRGNPGLLLAYWKKAFKTGPPDEKEKDAESWSDEQIVWIVPWEKVSKPAMPDDFTREHGMLLHTLLLHGGLQAGTLIPLLPFSAYETERYLSFLDSSEFLTNRNGILNVSPLALPVVRDYLKAEGYLRGL